MSDFFSFFIEVRPIADTSRCPQRLLFFLRSGTPLNNAVIRTKARQGQSDGESGEGYFASFAFFSGTLFLFVVETRRG